MPRESNGDTDDKVSAGNGRPISVLETNLVDSLISNGVLVRNVNVKKIRVLNMIAFKQSTVG